MHCAISFASFYMNQNIYSQTVRSEWPRGTNGHSSSNTECLWIRLISFIRRHESRTDKKLFVCNLANACALQEKKKTRKQSILYPGMGCEGFFLSKSFRFFSKCFKISFLSCCRLLLSFQLDFSLTKEHHMQKNNVCDNVLRRLHLPSTSF